MVCYISCKQRENIIRILKFRIQQGRAESPMEHIAQGKRSDTLGDPTINNIDAP